MDWTNVLTEYGQVGFGALILVILWKVIVNPTMENQRKDWKPFTHNLDSLTESTKALTVLSTTLAEVSVRQIQIIERLEVLVERLDNHIFKENRSDE